MLNFNEGESGEIACLPNCDTTTATNTIESSSFKESQPRGKRRRIIELVAGGTSIASLCIFKKKQHWTNQGGSSLGKVAYIINDLRGWTYEVVAILTTLMVLSPNNVDNTTSKKTMAADLRMLIHKNTMPTDEKKLQDMNDALKTVIGLKFSNEETIETTLCYYRECIYNDNTHLWAGWVDKKKGE